MYQISMSKTNNLQAQKGFKWFAIVALASLTLLGCSGQTKIKSDLGIKGAPDWVNEGSQAVKDKKGRLIQGVGSSEDLGDQALQLSRADTRARAEIARVLSSYVDAVVDDYAAASKSEAGFDSESTIKQQINNASKVVLSGSKIMGRWKDKETGTVYSFAELDLKKVKETIKATDTLNQGLKDYFQTKGQSLFDGLVSADKN